MVVLSVLLLISPRKSDSVSMQFLQWGYVAMEPFPSHLPLIFLIFLTCFRVMQSGEYLRGKRVGISTFESLQVDRGGPGQ